VQAVIATMGDWHRHWEELSGTPGWLEL